MLCKRVRVAVTGLLTALFVVTIVVRPVDAVLVQWTTSAGGNGHFYEAVLFSAPLTWQAARDDAIAKGGDLVSISSAAENAFVFSLIDSTEYWTLAGPHNYGPWIGGYQVDNTSEPSGNWAWSDGTPWTFTAWASGQPDNNGAAEHHAHYFVPSNTRAATWNDWTGGGLLVDGYVLEAVAIPEPNAAILLSSILGISSLGVLWKRARSRRKNTRPL